MSKWNFKQETPPQNSCGSMKNLSRENRKQRKFTKFKYERCKLSPQSSLKASLPLPEIEGSLQGYIMTWHNLSKRRQQGWDRAEPSLKANSRTQMPTARTSWQLIHLWLLLILHSWDGIWASVPPKNPSGDLVGSENHFSKRPMFTKIER